MAQIFTGNLSAPKAAAGEIPAVAVIMAGGSGTRFWPMSRTDFPKQFLPLGADSSSLIQATSTRVEPLVGATGVMVVTAAHQSGLVLQQLPLASVLSEPQARNTAACIGFAAKKVLATVGDVPMLCLPADHVVLEQERILEVYRQAIKLAAENDVLATIGITPTSPETGYGYIKRSSELFNGGPGYKVDCFVEKPDLATAESYQRSGDYYWNSGMFVWRPTVVLKAIAEFLPELSAALDQIARCFGLPDEYEKVAELYAAIKPVSIDVGIMEKAANSIMLPGDSFVWSDVGSWSSWSDTMRERSAEPNGNITSGDVLLLNSTGCTVVGQIQQQSAEAGASKKRRIIAGIGLQDLVIVDTPDALLIVPRDKAQDVKEVVQLLSKQGRNDLL